MRVSAPADRRFRRAHVKPAHARRWRDLGWRTLLRAALVVVPVVTAGVLAGSVITTTEALRVTRITVSGNVRLSRGEVLSLLDGLRGQNLVMVDLEAWRRRLLASPWVANAAMRRVFPGTVDVFIVEREPMAVGRINGRLYVVDQRGDVIDEFGPAYADLDLPIVDGLAAVAGESGLLIDEARAALAGRVLAALHAHPALASRVSQVDVTDVRDAVLILKGDTALVRVGDDRFAERLQSYTDLAAALRERVPQIDYVDLRFDERVYVRPRGSGVGAQKAGR
jgi:cell division protein FtsQ